MVKLRCLIKINTERKPFMYSLNTLALDCNRQIKINFDGGDLSSDAGLLLVKEFAAKLGFTKLKKTFSKPMIKLLV